MFFKRAWQVVREEITYAVLNLFDNGVMYQPINCIVVPLNVKNPARISEYSPISCCSTFYKVIFKVIIARLKLVMETLVNINSAASVPGRALNDNVILSHKLVKGYARQ